MAKIPLYICTTTDGLVFYDARVFSSKALALSRTFQEQGRTQGRVVILAHEALLVDWPSNCFSLSTSNQAHYLYSENLT